VKNLSAYRIRPVGLALSLALLGACAPLPPPTQPQHGAAAATREAPDAPRIHWPEAYAPEGASFFVHNTIWIDAPPEVVWQTLIQAEMWPAWYEGAENVKLIDGVGKAPTLAPDARFSWNTMGLAFTSTVKEFQPPYRLSWESRKSTIRGYHAWLILPAGRGSRVVTAESQHGFLTYLQAIFVPRKLHRLHDIWLGELKKKAERAALSR
jgi:uncharacterized protein YndB with AHSA1/START domain